MNFTTRVIAGGFAVAVALGFVAAIVAIQGLCLFLAWNYVMVPVFGMPALTFWQSCALAWLLAFVGKLLRGSKED